MKNESYFQRNIPIFFYGNRNKLLISISNGYFLIIHISTEISFVSLFP